MAKLQNWKTRAGNALTAGGKSLGKPMASEAKLGVSSDTREQVLDLASVSPALRSWIDNVIIPTLVREFLDQQRQNEVPAEKVRERGTVG